MRPPLLPAPACARIWPASDRLTEAQLADATARRWHTTLAARAHDPSTILTPNQALRGQTRTALINRSRQAPSWVLVGAFMPTSVVVPTPPPLPPKPRAPVRQRLVTQPIPPKVPAALFWHLVWHHINPTLASTPWRAADE